MSALHLGLLSWLVMGLVVGLIARFTLVTEPRPSLLKCLSSGLLAALAGGLLATALGFGGLSGYDPRALFTATLCAVVALLWLHGRSGPGRQSADNGSGTVGRRDAGEAREARVDPVAKGAAQ